MEFRCQDLRDAGVIPVSTESDQYRSLFSEIQRTSTEIIHEDQIGAILLNRSDKAIVAWCLIYKTEDLSGHVGGGNYVIAAGSIPSLLPPFGLTADSRKVFDYWNSILPGSKRYLEDGELFGYDNDVRPPQPDEVWKGSSFGFGGGSGLRRRLDEMKLVTLGVDGIFFSDGEFAGPNQLQLFERIVYEAEVY